jgi:excisionase family DNA binding protein
MNPLRQPYQIPRNPHERELSRIDPIMYRPVSPTLLPLLPILKAIYQQTVPKKPEETRPPEPPGEFMTTSEVAAYVKRSPNTIRLWCRQNIFQYTVLPGGDRVFSKESVKKWMAERPSNIPES